MDAVVKTISLEKDAPEIIQPKPKTTFLYVLASFLMGGGFFAPILGIIFFIVESFLPDDKFLNRIGSVFIIISIPMLLLGSHFLDKIDEKKRNAKSLASPAEAVFTGQKSM